MSPSETPGGDQSSVQEHSGWGFLVRLAWMGVGHILLLMAFVGIANSGKGWSIGGSDWLLIAAAIIVIALRYLDISRLHGRTMTGQPATMRHWRRYAVLVPLISAVLWAGAHCIAYFR